MAVGDVNVEVAVVVDVEQLGAEPERQEAGAEPGLLRDVFEQAVAAVLVERVQLLGEVGDEQLGKAVAIDVAAVDAHARLRLAVDVEADAGGIGDVLEGAVAVVAIEEIAHEIVGDVDVDVGVAVESQNTTPSPLPAGLAMPAGFDTSVKVPSPLLRKSRSGVPSKMVGLQYIR